MNSSKQGGPINPASDERQPLSVASMMVTIVSRTCTGNEGQASMVRARRESKPFRCISTDEEPLLFAEAGSRHAGPTAKSPRLSALPCNWLSRPIGARPVSKCAEPRLAGALLPMPAVVSTSDSWGKKETSGSGRSSPAGTHDKSNGPDSVKTSAEE